VRGDLHVSLDDSIGLPVLARAVGPLAVTSGSIEKDFRPEGEPGTYEGEGARGEGERALPLRCIELGLSSLGEQSGNIDAC
jgi:hypothetical protein